MKPRPYTIPIGGQKYQVRLFRGTDADATEIVVSRGAYHCSLSLPTIVLKLSKLNRFRFIRLRIKETADKLERYIEHAQKS